MGGTVMGRGRPTKDTKHTKGTFYNRPPPAKILIFTEASPAGRGLQFVCLVCFVGNRVWYSFKEKQELGFKLYHYRYRKDAFHSSPECIVFSRVACPRTSSTVPGRNGWAILEFGQ